MPGFVPFGSDAVEAFEDLLAHLGRDAGAVVDDREHHLVVGQLHGDADRRRAVLVRVLDQVADDAAHALRDRRAPRTRSGASTSTGRPATCESSAARRTSAARSMRRSSGRLPSSSILAAMKISSTIAWSRNDWRSMTSSSSSRCSGVIGAARCRHGTTDRRDRRPQLVAHGRDELRLHPVGVEQLRDVGALGLVEAGLGDRRGDGLGEQAEDLQIVLVELARRTARAR